MIVKRVNVTLHLGNGFHDMLQEITGAYTEKAVVVGVCSYHYNCYQVIYTPSDSFIQRHCAQFDRVSHDKKSKDFESSYTVGDTVTARNPGYDSNYHRHKFGLNSTGNRFYPRTGEEYVGFTLICQAPNEGQWLCSTPHWYDSASGILEDTAEKILHESEFKIHPYQ